MNIFINGNDGGGWSISEDNENLKRFILESGYRVTKNYFKADVIHNVWWNALKFPALQAIAGKKIIVTCSNYVDLDNPNYELLSHFHKINKFVKGWVSPSQKQKDIFIKHNINTFVLPFFVDKQFFYPLNKSRKEICHELNLDYKLLENKIVLSNFMRDSLGVDLYKPKWQKDPDLILEICKDLPKDKYIFLLAGPRRQYIIRLFKENRIPYLYMGQEIETEDYFINKVSKEKINKLYNITDIHLITSKSEGGPKAIPEAILAGTLVLSTDIGHARDYLEACFCFNQRENYKKGLFDLINDGSYKDDKVLLLKKKMRDNALQYLSKENMTSMLSSIYERI